MAKYLRNKIRTGQLVELWPVLLLLIVLAVPTLGSVWFALAAMENQQLATQQQLTSAYRGHLELVQREVDQALRELLVQVDRIVVDHRDSPQTAFAEIVQFGLASAVILRDEAGEVVYPSNPVLKTVAREDSGWETAERLEIEQMNYDAAAGVYEELAARATSDFDRAAAIQARMRCLLKADNRAAASDFARELVELQTLEQLVASDARTIVAYVQLVIVEQFSEFPFAMEVAKQLSSRAGDYKDAHMSSSQRLFLLKQLANRHPELVDQKVMRAEELVSDIRVPMTNMSKSSGFSEVTGQGIWLATSPQTGTHVLIDQQLLASQLASRIARANIPTEIEVAVLTPSASDRGAALLAGAASSLLPGWQLALSLRDSTYIDSLTQQRGRLYLWAGVLVVIFTSLLACVVGYGFRKQMRLARLRNDLVGTVSHELKTPLSSMRLLVDTLLDDEQFDEKTVREYLELIARENSRLSRLIDNFLTFSRLERDRMTFDFQLHSPEEIVEALMDAREGRLRVDATEFSVHIDPDLPPVLCDRDSILTALLNLLENAHKYSPPPRHIEMMVRNVGNAVQFSVSDRGIGMSRSDARRAFERFYQVDQRLSREGGGCGLGLSIVASIVQAHGGHVSVTSELGQGSTFMFGLPLALQTAIKT